MYPPQPEKIVSAAIRKHDHIIMGIRHYDKIMQDQLTHHPDKHNWEQGFITNHHRFLTREEAWHLAQANNQITWGQDRPPGKLFSEDLY